MDSAPQTQRVLIMSRAEYLDAADTLYGMARHELCIFDPDLEMLGLNAPARIQRLESFLQAGRENELRIALHDPSYAIRACPRLLEVLRRYSPRVHVYGTEGIARRAQDRFILADASHFVRRAVADQGRGVFALHEATEGRLLLDRFQEIWVSSTESVSATSLGL